MNFLGWESIYGGEGAKAYWRGRGMLEFMKWEVSSGRMGSGWWNRVNRRLVQDALTAWRGFDRGYRPTTYASEYWYDYIKARYVNPGWWNSDRKGYYGGDWRHAWRAHQESLRTGARYARPYYFAEARAERATIYAVLVNVESYYRVGWDLDSYLKIAIFLGTYPGEYPASRSQACRITLVGGWHTERHMPWYPELFDSAGRSERLKLCS